MNFKVGDEVETVEAYTGEPMKGTITKLRNYKYLGLVATIKPKIGKKKDICVVCLRWIPERRVVEEL